MSRTRNVQGLVILLMLMSTGHRMLRAGETFAFTDGFHTYAPGSDGYPVWDTAGMGWRMAEGAFRFAERSRDFAILERSPHGKVVTAKAVLTVRKALHAQWKVAGVCVHSDRENFWHLALVESPDNDGRRHFVELTEMLGGTWLAQVKDDTRLTRRASEGMGFNWQYEHAYHMTIELRPDAIVGTVCEPDGTVRTRISYALDNKAVVSGRPGLVVVGLAGVCTQFEAEVDMVVPVDKSKPARPAYTDTGYSRIKGKATGFFHVEQIGERWWVIDPTGNAFFIIGTDHANYNVHWCEKLGYAPYHRNVEKKYGGREQWSATMLERLRAWGFNSFGVNSDPTARYKAFPHLENLRMGTRFAEHDNITPKTTWTGFPNVFSADFVPFCDKMARLACAPYKDDPWLLGYFIDNELEWHAWTAGGPFVDSMAKPAEHTAKQGVVRFLRDRYDSPQAFNQAWGTTIGRFDELYGISELPRVSTARGRDDIREYVRHVADRYFAVTTAAIRKHDPNHMILGCRFAGHSPDLWDIAAKYSDVISVNCYRRVDLSKGVMADGFEQELAEWYGLTGKPFMVTEWSFPALDAGLPCKHGAGQRVPTQVERTFAFTVFQKLLFRTPHVVGSNYFMWADEPELGISSTFPEDSNYGLVNVNDEPYKLLTDAARHLHPLVYKIHSGRTTAFRIEPGARRGAVVVVNDGRAAGGVRVTTTVDGEERVSHVELAAGESRTLSVSRRNLPRPGVHVLTGTILPGNPYLDVHTAFGPATQSFYVPGVPWHTQGARASLRVPVAVSNPLPAALQNVPVVAGVELPPRAASAASIVVTLVDARTGQVVSGQLDRFDTGAEIAFMLDKLEPQSTRVFYAYLTEKRTDADCGPVRFAGLDDSFVISNNLLTLTKRSMSTGNAFDRIELGTLEMGRLAPLLWQHSGGNLWVGPSRMESYRVWHGPARVVVDAVMSRGKAGGPTKTEVDAQGRQARRRTAGGPFRTAYRVTIYPGVPWFSSRLLWLENTDVQPLEVKRYYHYVNSSIGGNAGDDAAAADHWVDAATGMCLGVVPASGSINVRFWLDKAGGQHPDADRVLDITLDPGERYAETEPCVYVVACSKDAWSKQMRLLRRYSSCSVTAFELESK